MDRHRHVRHRQPPLPGRRTSAFRPIGPSSRSRASPASTSPSRASTSPRSCRSWCRAWPSASPEARSTTSSPSPAARSRCSPRRRWRRTRCSNTRSPSPTRSCGPRGACCTRPPRRSGRPAVDGRPLSLEEIARTRAAAAWATERATHVVDTAHRFGGGTAVYADSPLQRRAPRHPHPHPALHRATRHPHHGRRRPRRPGARRPRLLDAARSRGLSTGAVARCPTRPSRSRRRRAARRWSSRSPWSSWSGPVEVVVVSPAAARGSRTLGGDGRRGGALVVGRALGGGLVVDGREVGAGDDDHPVGVTQRRVVARARRRPVMWPATRRAAPRSRRAP